MYVAIGGLAAWDMAATHTAFTAIGLALDHGISCAHFVTPALTSSMITTTNPTPIVKNMPARTEMGEMSGLGWLRIGVTLFTSAFHFLLHFEKGGEAAFGLGVEVGSAVTDECLLLFTSGHAHVLFKRESFDCACLESVEEALGWADGEVDVFHFCIVCFVVHLVLSFFHCPHYSKWVNKSKSLV